MAKAVGARTLGDDYQARWFWLQAYRLCEPKQLVARVDYDHNDETFFEDVVTRYQTGKLDEHLKPLHADYWQTKCKVVQDQSFSHESLIDADFIHAKTSLLQRAQEIVESKTKIGENVRLHIVMPLVIEPKLGKCVETNTGIIRFDKLPAEIRKSWREHLKLSDDASLEKITRHIRIVRGYSPPQLIERINDVLPRYGFREIHEQGTFPYDDLIRKAQQFGNQEFDRETLIALAKGANLWVGEQTLAHADYRIGIKSFERAAEYLETQCDDLLSLTEFFDGRYLKSNYDWNKDIFPRLEQFLKECISKCNGRRCVLMLETHASIAFAAGLCLDTKCGMHVVPAQKTFVKHEIWDPEKCADSGPEFRFIERAAPSSTTDVLVGISITHSVKNDVDTFISKTDLNTCRLVECEVEKVPGKGAVRNAKHALELSMQLASYLKKERTADERNANAHIFAAAPNAFLFFLGRNGQSLGHLHLYEYDFDTSQPGAYNRSLSF